MATITITIEDTSPGRFRATVSPSMEVLVKMHQDGVALTNAQNIALLAVKTIMQSSEEGAETRGKKKILNPYGR